MGVVFLEDDDAVNSQSAPRVSNELAPPHLVPARRCIEEIHEYSLCLQTSACPVPLAKATDRATTPRCEGAPTEAAITQLVEERVRATGDDEATARAYLTSYDLCAKWGDEETKQPVRKINQCVWPAWRYHLLFWPPRRSARVLGVLARGLLGLLTQIFYFRTGNSPTAVAGRARTARPVVIL